MEYVCCCVFMCGGVVAAAVFFMSKSNRFGESFSCCCDRFPCHYPTIINLYSTWIRSPFARCLCCVTNQDERERGHARSRLRPFGEGPCSKVTLHADSLLSNCRANYCCEHCAVTDLGFDVSHHLTEPLSSVEGLISPTARALLRIF